MGEKATSAPPTPSPLQKVIETYLQDEAWLLSHFTFVADVTTLASQCDVAHSPGMSVASCRALPHHVLSFLGEAPDLLQNYVGFLLQPGTQAYFLVNETQRAIVEQALPVLEIVPEWQMVFRGTVEALPVMQSVTTLEPRHLAAMRELGQLCGLLMMERDPLERGPAVGVFVGDTLVAMATTRLQIPGAAEIGNVATHPDYRRRGYGKAVLSALVRRLWDPHRLIFALIHQTSLEAIALAEQLGFAKARPMYLMRCLIPESCAMEPETSEASSQEASASQLKED